jgi:hypothetical protein
MKADDCESIEPWDDPVVREVRQARHARHARQALFAASGNDLEAFARRLREAQVAGGRRTVSRPPRRPDGWSDRVA